MKFNEPKRVSVYWLLLAALLMVMVVFNVHASGDDLTNILKDGDNTAQNSASISGSRSYGVGGADYDIGRGSCKFHVGGFTVAIAQTDEFCEGMELIRAGLVQAGIRHICKQSKVRKNYDDYEECKAEMSVIIPHESPPESSGQAEEDDEDYHEALEARLAAIESQRMHDSEKVQKAAQRAYAAAREAEQRVVHVEPKPFLTEQQAQSLRIKK